MKAILTLSEDEIEALYFMLSYVFEVGLEFVEEDAYMNKPLKVVFNKVTNAFEDMNAPIDEDEKKFLEERLK